MCTKLEDACTTHVRIVKQAGTAVSLLHQNWPQKDTESHSQYRAGPQPTMTYKALLVKPYPCYCVQVKRLMGQLSESLQP
jgi:hypothetical protein